MTLINAYFELEIDLVSKYLHAFCKFAMFAMSVI